MLNKYLAKILFVLLVLVTIFSCKDNDNGYKELRANELKILEEFIAANNYEDYKKESGLYFIVVNEGTGDSIKNGDRVRVDYEIRLLKDSSLIEPFNPFYYREFIVGVGQNNETEGLNEALTYMKPGGEAILILPSEIAYGSSGDSYGYVGGFQTLLMNVKIHRVYPAED